MAVYNTFSGAIADLTKAAELGMDFAFFKRGVAKNDLNAVEGALKDFTTYINKGGKYVWVFRERANIYFEKEMFQESLEDYLSSITVDPNEEFVSHEITRITYGRV